MGACRSERALHLLSRLARQLLLVFVEEPMTDAREDHLEHLQLGAEMVAVSPSRRSVPLADGWVCGCDSLISTLLLPKLVQAMGQEAPEAVCTAAA